MAINHHPHSAFLRPIVTLALLLCMAVEANAEIKYYYYILNKKGEATLWCEVRDNVQSPGSKPDLPPWMKSPLVDEYHYWATSSMTQYGDDRENKSEYMYVNIKASKNTANSILRKCWKLNEGATELKALPSGVSTYNILVTYDVKEEKDFTINIKGDSVKIDLTQASQTEGKSIQELQEIYAKSVPIDVDE